MRMANSTVLLALFLRVGEVVILELCSPQLIEWGERMLVTSLFPPFQNPTFSFAVSDNFVPLNGSVSFLFQQSLIILQGTCWGTNGYDQESDVYYFDCTTLKYEFCYGSAIIFHTLTLLFPLVMCHILLVIICITSGINYTNQCMFVML